MDKILIELEEDPLTITVTYRCETCDETHVALTMLDHITHSCDDRVGAVV